MTQFLFERYKPTGFFIAKDATLAAFASGRATAAVLDCGESASTVSIVHDGYILKKCMSFNCVSLACTNNHSFIDSSASLRHWRKENERALTKGLGTKGGP